MDSFPRVHESERDLATLDKDEERNVNKEDSRHFNQYINNHNLPPFIDLVLDQDEIAVGASMKESLSTPRESRRWGPNCKKELSGSRKLTGKTITPGQRLISSVQIDSLTDIYSFVDLVLAEDNISSPSSGISSMPHSRKSSFERDLIDAVREPRKPSDSSEDIELQSILKKDIQIHERQPFIALTLDQDLLSNASSLRSSLRPSKIGSRRASLDFGDHIIAARRTPKSIMNFFHRSSMHLDAEMVSDVGTCIDPEQCAVHIYTGSDEEKLYREIGSPIDAQKKSPLHEADMRVVAKYVVDCVLASALLDQMETSPYLVQYRTSTED